MTNIARWIPGGLQWPPSAELSCEWNIVKVVTSTMRTGLASAKARTKIQACVKASRPVQDEVQELAMKDSDFLAFFAMEFRV